MSEILKLEGQEDERGKERIVLPIPNSKIVTQI